jgi:undecaprenyl-phosphate galactose phosphotransferase
MIYEGAYTKKFTFWDEIKLLWKVSFFSTITTLAIVSLGKLSYAVSRTLILQIGLLSLGIFPLLRISAKHWLVRAGLLTRKVLIIGTNDTGKRALRALKSEPNLGYEVVGFIENKQSRNKKYIESEIGRAHV